MKHWNDKGQHWIAEYWRKKDSNKIAFRWNLDWWRGKQIQIRTVWIRKTN